MNIELMDEITFSIRLFMEHFYSFIKLFIALNAFVLTMDIFVAKRPEQAFEVVGCFGQSKTALLLAS